MQVWSLGWDDPLEEGMANHLSTLAWRNPIGRGLWQATVHRILKSGRWPKEFFYCLLTAFVWGQYVFYPKWLTSWASHLPPLSLSEPVLLWSKFFATWSLTRCIYLDDLMFLICLHYMSPKAFFSTTGFSGTESCLLTLVLSYC